MTDFGTTDKFYRDALDSAQQGVWDYNIETGAKFYSRTWYQIRGLNPDSLPYSNDDAEWLNTVHPDDRKLAEQQTRQLNAGQIDEVNYEYRERHADGRWIWIMCRGRAVEWDANKDPVRFVGTDTDISAVKASEEELQHTHKKLQLALSSIDAGIWEYRSTDNSVFWDARQRLIYGVPLDLSPLPRDVWEKSIHPDDLDDAVRKADEALVQRCDYSLSYRIIRRDGEMRHIDSHVSFLHRDDQGYSLVGLDLDVTEDWLRSQELILANQNAENRNIELEKTRQKLENTLLYDTLTGLGNRRSLENLQKATSLNPSIHKSGPAVMLMNLDGFKQINSVFGHDAGDYVLRHTADILKNVNHFDTFPVRTGGDEFALFLPDPPDDNAILELATDLIAQVSQPVNYQGFKCRVGISIGVARTDPDVGDSSQLLRDADLALNKAKSTGRKRVAFCEPALRNEAARVKGLGDELLIAVERREFTCAYQAQFDMQTGELSGIEALARWPRRDGFIRQPSAFLPVAEVMDLIALVDKIILEKAVADFQSWNKTGLKVPKLSVNISKSRLRDGNLINDIKSFDIDYTTLCLELLESSFLEEYDPYISNNLEGLKSLGIEFEVDDFGTGHASILSLVRLEPNRLKIDRAFIEPIQQSQQQAQLVKSIIEIGHLLGMKIIAEGVETTDQYDILRGMGCDYCQGYLLARPMSFAEFTRKFTV